MATSFSYLGIFCCFYFSRVKCCCYFLPLFLCPVQRARLPSYGRSLDLSSF